MRYIDGTDLIAGRLCSFVAKSLLEGDSVIVGNAQNVLFSGKLAMVVSDWMQKLTIASVGNPKHGPFHPRTPSGMLTRMVRGMVPRRRPKGRFAMKRLRVYSGIPTNYANAKFTTLDKCKATKPTAFYVPLSEVARRIGWKGDVRPSTQEKLVSPKERSKLKD